MMVEPTTGPDSDAAAPVIRAAIVEDLPDMREGLTLLIEETDGYRCTGSYESVEEAIEGIGSDPPDVVLMDIGLPGMSGIEGVRVLKERNPSLQFVMLTVYEDDERIFQALCAGANGYLLKKTPPDQILARLAEAVEGGSPMSPEVARRVIEVFHRIRPPRQADHDLTPQETRMLKLLVDGHNYRSAASELGVSINTVATHIKHIYSKLQVHSKSEAVARALRDGLIG
jgi:DNA-binding NarL/FixJ family response regulator